MSMSPFSFKEIDIPTGAMPMKTRLVLNAMFYASWALTVAFFLYPTPAWLSALFWISTGLWIQQIVDLFVIGLARPVARFWWRVLTFQ